MPSSTLPERFFPLVTIIIPTYNYGHFIGQTLECIQAQTYSQWECIVVDDGSTDNTSEVVAGYVEKDDRIKYIYQSNQGQAAARNTAIKISSGKYFQFLDADDLIEAAKIEQQVEYLRQHPEIDIVYGSGRYFTADNRSARLYSMRDEDKPWMPNISGTGENVLAALIRRNIMMVNAPLIRTSVIDTVGLFDVTLPPLEDWDYWIRCAAQEKQIQYADLDGTLALVRSHPSSSSKNGRRLLTAALQVRRKINMITAEAHLLRLNKEMIAKDEGWLGVEEVLDGSTIKGACRLCKAAAMSSTSKGKMKWFTCAVVSPFVSKRQFRSIASSSLSQSVTNLVRRSKRFLSRERFS